MIDTFIAKKNHLKGILPVYIIDILSMEVLSAQLGQFGSLSIVVIISRRFPTDKRFTTLKVRRQTVKSCFHCSLSFDRSRNIQSKILVNNP